MVLYLKKWWKSYYNWRPSFFSSGARFKKYLKRLNAHLYAQTLVVHWVGPNLTIEGLISKLNLFSDLQDSSHIGIGYSDTLWPKKIYKACDISRYYAQHVTYQGIMLSMWQIKVLCSVCDISRYYVQHVTCQGIMLS